MSKKTPTIKEQLFRSASKGDVLVLSYLLRERGVSPDLRDRYDATPLMVACRFGQFDCVQLLVEMGADVNAVDKEKCSVLIHACSGNSNRLIVEYLIAHGTKVNKRDAYGCTALMRAASKGDVSVLRALIDNDAKVNVVSENDETPLTFGIVWHHIDVVKALIKAGANLNWADQESWTPLQYALYEKQPDIANLLQDHGARLPSAVLPKGKRVASKQDQPNRRVSEK